MPPGKTDYNAWIYNHRRLLEEYNAEIRLNTPLTKEIVEAEKPDAVILATGSGPLVLPIPGLDNTKFVKSAIDVLRGRTSYGKNAFRRGSSDRRNDAPFRKIIKGETDGRKTVTI